MLELTDHRESREKAIALDITASDTFWGDN